MNILENNTGILQKNWLQKHNADTVCKKIVSIFLSVN